MSSPAFYPKFRACDPSTGLPLVGGKLYTYAAGTTTPLATYSDASLTVANANPIILDANGEAVIYVGPSAYKFVLQESDGSAVWTFDNYSPNVASVPSDGQWFPYTGTPSFSTATSFSVSGDATATFTAGRRLRSTNTAGTRYSTVVSSSFGGINTSVVVVNDSGSLDSGMSSVYVGLLTYSNPAYLDPLSVVDAVLTGDITGFAAKTQVTGFTEIVDALGEFSAGVFTAKFPGYYDISMTASASDSAGSATTIVTMNIAGSDVREGAQQTTAANTRATQTIRRLALLSAGDTVKFYFQGTANTTLRALAPSNPGTAISIHRVR